MGKKLYVGNLPFSATDESLAGIFAQVGFNVESAKVIKDKFSGRSKGYGFVEFANDEDANKSKDQLNGAEVDGRTITVAEANPQVERGDRGRGGGGGYGGRGRSGGGGGYGGGGRDGGGGGDRY